MLTDPLPQQLQELGIIERRQITRHVLQGVAMESLHDHVLAAGSQSAVRIRIDMGIDV